ncbi:MAG TPA: class I SAM-dependent methyltransferase [Dongiaceae bacterium]|nr:class I SAM-dependent methyltransferase [Dongiaceae bacterium]
MTEASNTFTDGKAYERMMGRWSRVVGGIFLDWLKQPDNLRWLDVGCGNGAFTEEVITRCHPAAMEGIDPSAEQIAFARERTGTRMAHFQQADAQVLPFGDDSFEVATMALVIAFIPDPAKAVRELARVLQPGGLAAAYMWEIPGQTPLAPLHNTLRAMGMEPQQPPSSAVAQPEALQDLWHKAGLTAVETRSIRIPVSYENLDDFCASNIVPLGPHAGLIATMSPETKAQLRERLREALPIATDGSIVYEAVAHAVKGRAPS